MSSVTLNTPEVTKLSWKSVVSGTGRQWVSGRWAGQGLLHTPRLACAQSHPPPCGPAAGAARAVPVSSSLALHVALALVWSLRVVQVPWRVIRASPRPQSGS